MAPQIVTVKGKRFVMIEEPAFRRLEKLASKAQKAALPAWPQPDVQGNRSAVEFGQVSIARSVIEERTAAGLSQQELAKLAGVRQETISRLESGKHSPTVRTVERIDRALQKALRQSQAKKKRKL